jgi:hypothetical protein
MVTEPRSRDALAHLGSADYEELRQKLRECGVSLRRYVCQHPIPGCVGPRLNVILLLSVAASANCLTNGRRHNSYVASREEVLRIADVMRAACGQVGVAIEPLWFQIVRLDVFVDALLLGSSGGYFDLLCLMCRSAGLQRGMSYSNGINGFGDRFGWTFYGKGKHLLRRAQKKGWLCDLLNERSAQCAGMGTPVSPGNALEIRRGCSLRVPGKRVCCVERGVKS